MHDNRMLIETQVVVSRVKDSKSPLKERVREAMIAARKGSGIMMLSDEEKFKIAVAAMILVSEGEDKDRLNWEVKCLKALAAAFDGIPINLEAMAEYAKEGADRGWEVLGLTQMWRATEDEQ